MLQELIPSLNEGKALDGDTICAVIKALVSDELTAQVKADFLSALASKGETVQEIAGFATGLRAMA
ncbi:MAG: anthranilate phosphoribosyltransferase, partial [Limisphaerales bacterium]